MNLFEADHFEERIQAVENRAGRIAWEVILMIQALILIGLPRLVEDYQNYLYPALAGSILISLFVSVVVKSMSGVEEKYIQEERRRLGRTPKLKLIMRKKLIYSAILLVVFAVLIYPPEKWSISSIPVIIIALGLGLYIAYRVEIYKYLGSKPRKKIKKDIKSHEQT
jgi:hypothetical protein